MDSQRLKDIQERLELLDDRLGHRIRPSRHHSFVRAGAEQVEERVRDLAEFTSELHGLVAELVQALAAREG
ncbi:MAG: hypothetical protein KJ058_11395 [Thermoanaerobaculia bacterium]|nr:hypothetical protein [Thermoanaerobaculia bacterium]MCZ7652946.1 hypothetical protein [Thermoanaerobaculia bacterium]